MAFFATNFSTKNLNTYLKPLLILPVAGLTLLISWLYLSRDIFFDDAFMFIRYAGNLEEHGVFGWNDDEPTYGCTSMGYVFSTFLFMKASILQWVSQAKFLQIQSVGYFLLALYTLYLSSKKSWEKIKSS